jgi:hypothetical protein
MFLTLHRIEGTKWCLRSFVSIHGSQSYEIDAVEFLKAFYALIPNLFSTRVNINFLICALFLL